MNLYNFENPSEDIGMKATQGRLQKGEQILLSVKKSYTNKRERERERGDFIN